MPDHSANPACPDPQGCRADGVPEDCVWCAEGDATVTPVVEPQLPTQLPSMSVGSEPQQSMPHVHEPSGPGEYCTGCFDQGAVWAKHEERARIIAIIEGLIGPAVTDVGSLRNEAFADAIAAIKEHR